MNKLRLILGDQLNINHSWFKEKDSKITYVMMEIKDETSYVLHHAQKIIATFAAMRFFAEQLQQKGFEVIYFKINDKENEQGFYQNINKIIKEKNIGTLQYLEPDEYRLSIELKKLESIENIKVESVDTEHFLVPKFYAKDFFSEKKHWRMEEFYRNMRKKFSILMDGDKPIGGKWNFDSDNRKRWDGSPNTTEDFRPSHNHEKLFLEINNENIEHFGEGQESNFRWPISREESVKLLDNFMAKDLVNFGDFQDALHDENWRLFHSFLSFSLNSKMLSPLEVIRKAEEAYYEKDLPLSSVEGFIRQILGWREYIRGVYWANMPGYDQHNFFKHNAKLPDWFWTGKTDMRCLSLSISQSLKNAYAHHIQRLMIIGNFSLLAGLDPKEVHKWYLGIYIDAYEWVEMPNTLGMSQFADGGLLATKPYVSSAAYINKMGNYCSSCKYKLKEKLGEDACPFNSLYWNFFDRHQDKLSNNPRLGIVNSQLKKMDQSQKEEINKKANFYLNNLNSL
jgi:deoxyribodipyrimidine photolyase-related protein